MDPNDYFPWFNPDQNTWLPTSTPPSTTPPPVRTPTPMRPQSGFLPYQSPQAGYQAAHSPVPLFPTLSPSQGDQRIRRAMRQFSPFESSPGDFQRAINLGDDTETTETTEPEPEIPPRARRGGGRGGRTGGRRPSRAGRGSGSSTDSTPKHPYSTEETDTLARCWVDVGHNPIVSNNQRAAAMWKTIAERYNIIKPHGTPERTGEMLRNHWKRVHPEIKNFQAYYVQAESVLGSGRGGQDVLTNAMAQFLQLRGFHFKHQSTWHIVRNTQKFLHATRTEDAVKRCRNNFDGDWSESQSPSSAASAASAPSAPETTDTDDNPVFEETYGGGSYRARPQGTQSAMRGRRKGKAPAGEGSSSTIAQKKNELAKIADTLEMAEAYDLFTKDIDNMTPHQLQRHNEFLDMIRHRFGPPQPQVRSAPTDDDNDE